MRTLKKIQQGNYHDPFELLGLHEDNASGYIIRALMPTACAVEVKNLGVMTRIEDSDIFELKFSAQQKQVLPAHYTLCWKEKHGNDVDNNENGAVTTHQAVSAYSFPPQISQFDLDLFAAGRHLHIYRILGAHLKTVDDIEGCLFAVWVPNVRRVSVIGDFNHWHGLRHPMRSLGHSGVWELFIPSLKTNDTYKFEILTQSGQLLHKTDPYAGAMGLRPETSSKITSYHTHQWNDANWLSAREKWQWLHQPISIYEVHAGSWRRNDKGEFLSYIELAEQLVPYVKYLGYTHIEFLPLTEHPLDQSWGYQVSGYYAPTARHGSPDEFRTFIDICHQNNIGVILDWVPAHFPRDDFALAKFNGEAVYEYGEPEKGEHQDWGTLIFNYGRNEVRNFLIANAIYWIKEFHLDGLRVDAVASMLYLDYSREHGQWMPNIYGGHEHLEAIDFIKELNATVHQQFSGIITLAEESTDWPMVSRPVDVGGLGFSIKWNMGWMHDTLSYMQTDPVYRGFHQNQLTFSQLYAYSENFILPLSHDEVVHMKRSMLDKMPGDVWQKFANLRLLYAYQYAHPGKKLLFMGGEFGQWNEWSEAQSLDWMVAGMDKHAGLSNLIKDLNQLYCQQQALYALEFEAEGFQWISCDDDENSVLAFIRRFEDKFIVCVFNFTPVPRNNYIVGVPEDGYYIECLNTDAQWYGGSNAGNAGGVNAQLQPDHDFDYSLCLTLPPLSALFFIRD